MHCSRSTDTRDVKQVLKTFNSAFMLLLVQKEQHKPSFQPHIIISVLQTFKANVYFTLNAYTRDSVQCVIRIIGAPPDFCNR